MEGQNNTSCISEFAFYFNLGKSMLDLDVTYYVRSIISFSGFLVRTPRCVPHPGAESVPARLIDNLPLTAELIPCLPCGFSAPWTGLPLGKTEMAGAH